MATPVPSEPEPTSSPALRTPTSAISTATPVGDRERSNYFWRNISYYSGKSINTYESLGEITREVHLIVRGRVVGFREDQFFGYGGGGIYPIVSGLVDVTEVLKGTPRIDENGLLLVAELAWPDMTHDDLPTDEVILFLFNEAQQRSEGGFYEGDDNAIYRYWRPNSYQTMLRNDAGRVLVTRDRGGFQPADSYPLNLRGESFDDVVDRIRRLAADD